VKFSPPFYEKFVLDFLFNPTATTAFETATVKCSRESFPIIYHFVFESLPSQKIIFKHILASRTFCHVFDILVSFVDAI